MYNHKLTRVPRIGGRQSFQGNEGSALVRPTGDYAETETASGVLLRFTIHGADLHRHELEYPLKRKLLDMLS